jgi:hypothetical protein
VGVKNLMEGWIFFQQLGGEDAMRALIVMAKITAFLSRGDQPKAMLEAGVIQVVTVILRVAKDPTTAREMAHQFLGHDFLVHVHRPHVPGLRNRRRTPQDI